MQLRSEVIKRRETTVSIVGEYDPSRLLDCLIKRWNLKSDAALASMLGVDRPTISKIRNKRLPLGASVLIRIHEITGVSIYDLRKIMGDRRARTRACRGWGKNEK